MDQLTSNQLALTMCALDEHINQYDRAIHDDTNSADTIAEYKKAYNDLCVAKEVIREAFRNSLWK